MALQGSGQIKLTELVTEFGGTAPYSLKAYYRGGGRVPTNNTNVPTSGAIGLKNFYNAVNRVTAVQTYSTNTTQTTLNVSTLSGYVAGITDVTVYVSSNVYVYSTDTATPALTISGATAGDTVTLVNNGFIMGKGGNGTEQQGFNSSNGTPGGPAMSLGYNINITNNSYIAGGGGGGGAGPFPTNSLSGGGAGGGTGGGSIGPNYFGGAGGGPGQVGAQGFGAGAAAANFPNYGGGAGGGRILPGTGGSGSQFSTKPGSGGAGGGGTGGNARGGDGGSAGNAGADAASAGGGGGGWGARGGNCQTGLGGAGGKAINLNGFTVTYITAGTVYGAVS
jgi:hypothetical protein